MQIRRIETKLFTTIMLLYFYSFGVFGFLNLFGLRIFVQAAVVAISLILIFKIKSKYDNCSVLIVSVFATVYAVGSWYRTESIATAAEPILLLIIMIIFNSAEASQIEYFAKSIVVSALIFSSFIIIAYWGYAIWPETMNSANYDIYSSTVSGYEKLSPGSIFDWFSFTSGDGFVIGETEKIRFKGYAYEPSATVVHYLAPVVLAFLIGGFFNYCGIVILIVNVTLISSLMSLIIIFLAIFIFCITRYSPRLFKPIMFIIFILGLSSLNNIANLFLIISDFASDYLNTDFLSRKIDNGSDGSNFMQRVGGLGETFWRILSSPFGFSYSDLPPGAGLIFIIGSICGWLGLLIFLGYVYKWIDKIIAGLLLTFDKIKLFAISLAFSMSLILLIFSGYGWNRLSGIIMLVTIYSLVNFSIDKQVGNI